MSDCCAPVDGSFDLAVIGAGSAGFSAAIAAADEGARVALVGHGTIGGTCVNVGCIPSKALIRAMEVMHVAGASARFDGIEAKARIIDWSAVIRQKQALVEDLRRAKYTDLLPAYDGIAYMEGRARYAPSGALTVGGVTLDAGKVVIATGARPHLPEIPGLGDVPWHDSTSILDLTELPRSLIVVGGGYVGAELAQLFARAGVRVTVVTRRGLLPAAEPEIAAALTGYFAGEGIEVLRVLGYRRVANGEGGIELALETQAGATTIAAEALLLATGRTPNVEDLGLARARIETNGNGGILVDDRMRTTREGTYAAGDVTGHDQFVYMAAYGAKIAARNALNGDALSYDSRTMPAVVFSDPQVASVGLTEAAARDAGHEVAISVLPLDMVPRAVVARDTRGLVKLVADARTKRLLGAHILAPEGADSIQTAALALRAGMTYDELGAMVFPYLTTVEGLKLAAQTFETDIARLSCCAG